MFVHLFGRGVTGTSSFIKSLLIRSKNLENILHISVMYDVTNSTIHAITTAINGPYLHSGYTKCYMNFT
jgi:hypothetical protein